MKKRWISILTMGVFISTFLSGCKATETKVDVSNINPKDHGSNIAKYTGMMDSLSKDENVCVSPLSFNTVFAFAANGGDAKTKLAMEDFLEMPIEDYNNWILSLSNSYKTDRKNEVSLANSIWLNKSPGNDFKNDFRQISDTYYNGEAYIEDLYARSSGDRVNKWVDKNTKGMIKQIKDPGPVGMESLLLNTLYFKGSWEKPFKEHSVLDEKFTELSGKESDMKSMHSTTGEYFENDKASGFAYGYEGGRYEFIGILPKEEGSFNVSDIDIEALLETRTQDYDVYFSIPKFTIETTAEGEALKEALLKQGFSYNDMAFPNIASSDFSISNIIQKTKVIVDEEGTEAAAVTGIELMSAAPGMDDEPEIKEVYLTRPFVYLIYDSEYEQIMFMGKVVNIPQ